MDLILRILGILALLVFVGVASVAAFIWWHWRKIKRMAGAGLPPATIDLIDDTQPGWLTKSPYAETAHDFEQQGFVRSGPFEIVGISEARVLGFTHPDRRLRACCYQHPAVGCVVDIVATLESGIEITVTNAATGSEMDTRPDTEKVFLAGQAVPELLEAIRKKIGDRPLRAAAPEAFKQDFIDAYTRDMAWRTNKLGVSEAEFRRVAMNEKQTYSEEQILAAFRETKRQELHQWTGEVGESFAQSTDLSVSSWKKFEDNLVLYRADFHPTAYLDYLGQAADLPESDRVKLETAIDEGLPLDQLRDRVAETTGQRFVRLGAVERPFACEIFGIERKAES